MKFDYHNTIIVDTEIDNCIDHVENSLIVPTYTREAVESPETDNSLELLAEMKAFLTKLLNEADDVREFLAAHPKYRIPDSHIVPRSVPIK